MPLATPTRAGRSDEGTRREGWVELAIRDNGRAIDPALLPRIFDAFVQAKKPGDAGLGLGLAIVRRLVTMHEGTVTAASEGLGKGSEFLVRLPLPASEPSLCPAWERFPIAPEVAPLSIVLVEDNDDLREEMKELLEEMGHSVEAAEDGETGVELISTAAGRGFVDIGLPVLDGCGVAERVRAGWVAMASGWWRCPGSGTSTAGARRKRGSTAIWSAGRD